MPFEEYRHLFRLVMVPTFEKQNLTAARGLEKGYLVKQIRRSLFTTLLQNANNSVNAKGTQMKRNIRKGN